MTQETTQPQTASSQQASASPTDDATLPLDATLRATIVRVWNHPHARRIRGTLLVAARAIRELWRMRMRFSYACYFIVFTVVTAASVTGLQWGMYTEPQYDDPDSVDATTRIQQSVAGQVTRFVSQMWLEQRYVWLLNFLILGLIYLLLTLLINRFWIATAAFGATMVVFAVANAIKVKLRNEPVIPADMSFISGGNSGDIMSFVPSDSLPLVHGAVGLLAWFVAGCVALQLLDGRNGFIPFSWRHPFRDPKTVACNCMRVFTLMLTATLFVSFTWNLGVSGSGAQQWSRRMGDAPQLWNAYGDAKNNGPAINFLRLAHTKAMDKPEGYNKDAMEQLAAKYAKQASQINRSRANQMTDGTVILLLSESFSDPNRVPGVSFSEDPMPYIRSVKAGTTSGLMLSPGYGGGTANIEYQALTGLSMANYDSSLSVAYQQLVPGQQWSPSFNQLWSETGGSSIAFHSFDRNMYFRDVNYRKFGFSTFWAKDGKNAMSGLHPIDSAWYSSDEATYANVLEHVNDADRQFIQVVTMQNHMPYNDWYRDNQFKDADTSENVSDAERTSIDTYAKGVNYTDQYTREFLAQLDRIDRPITVIYYGDHLPGIYATAASDPANSVTLHETDYFIWSNAASASRGAVQSASGYTSSNYFMAQAAEHMNAKVTPYLAFLTAMREAIPAIGPAGSGSGTDKPTYLDASGKVVAEEDLPAKAKRMLAEYRLIQYDMSVGKHYLKDTGFVEFG
ncbi:LTA synthase family protein [Bifidobacterium amazonense]|uniref:LTA synthase family protein n=1 Tax=Bifidobacterium amazonense TaxID=2809027 RepID=A0ABS9VYK2_9BIFI|nr:LTA synthase family protein [Bifidobacterium amazonense]MCH9277195.1 LTA synthase family protein [Bifidobacterium amazonense]